MDGKTDGKPVNRAGDEEPWLGSCWSMAVFMAGALMVGALASRHLAPRVQQVTVAVQQQAPRAAPPFPAQAEAATPLERVVRWAVSGDAGGRPFVVVDKRGAHVKVFDAQGRLMQSVPALMGSALGDDTVPGIGDKPLAQVKPEERITPAGRFVAQMGETLTGEDVVWIDYEAAVSMHRVRVVKESERRFERLASETIADNRISNGCINLPVAFYEQMLKPLVQAAPTVVYVLPEQRSLQEVFARSSSAKPAQAPRQPVL